MNKSGSTILLIVIISAVIMIYYNNLWLNTCLMSNVFYKQYEYEQKFRLTESLYKYGLFLTLNNIDLLTKQKEKNNNIVLYNGPWPFNSSKFNGIFQLAFVEEKCKLQASILQSKDTSLFIINSLLEIQEDETPGQKKIRKFLISDWRINS